MLLRSLSTLSASPQTFSSYRRSVPSKHEDLAPRTRQNTKLQKYTRETVLAVYEILSFTLFLSLFLSLSLCLFFSFFLFLFPPLFSLIFSLFVLSSFISSFLVFTYKQCSMTIHSRLCVYMYIIDCRLSRFLF